MEDLREEGSRRMERNEACCDSLGMELVDLFYGFAV